MAAGDVKNSVREAAEAKVKNWVEKQKHIQERKRPTRVSITYQMSTSVYLIYISDSEQSPQTTQLSGWLKKVGTTKLTSTRRWVVLDGQTLMYFKDDTVSTIPL